MIYAYVSTPIFDDEWLLEKIEAETLEEARKKYIEHKAAHPEHTHSILVGAPNLETIHMAYSGKIY